MGRGRRTMVGLAVVAGGAALAVGVLALEVVIAGRGPLLTEYEPSLADGRIEPGGADRPDGSAADPLHVVWIGDSTAAGVGASSADASVSRQVSRRLADELGRPIDVEVVAVSGARVADVLADQLPLVDPAADVVVISVGANDTTHLTSTGEFAENYRALLDGLPDDAVVVALGVPDLGSVTRLAQPLRALAGWRGSAYDAIIAEEADRVGAVRVDIAAETGPAFRADPGRLLAADSYHPSDEGYRVWADAIVPVAADRLRGS